MTRSGERGSARIGVVGGGLGGLAAACTLAARGHAVTLFESNLWLGGKAARLDGESADGDRFRFDMGPTILTVPRVLRRIFEEAGRRLEDEIELIRLDPQWRCFFDDGAVLDLHQQIKDMKRTLDGFNGDKDLGAGYERFIRYAKRLHDVSERFFFWKPIGGLRDVFDPSQSFNIAVLRDVLGMRMGSSVARTIRGHVGDSRVAQMLDHFTQYVGSSPYRSPAILCSIASMQTEEGVWYPVGGTRAVPEALQRLAVQLGVEVRLGESVERIVVEGGRVTGVTTAAGQTVELGAVVSNMDALRTFRELIGGDHARRFEGGRKFEPACSGVVLYLGLKQRYDHLLHHDFVFSRDPEEEFDFIYRRGEPAPDPTCYVAAPARTDPAVAPDGAEALYVLVHTPYVRDRHDWSRGGDLFKSYRRTIIEKLKRTAKMTDLEDRIVYEDALTPLDIHERYRVLKGAIYGLASHGKFLGAFKPNNRTRIRGLYLSGGAAHPGPGMPMVLMSGWIAADTLDRDGVVEPAARPAFQTAAP